MVICMCWLEFDWSLFLKVQMDNTVYSQYSHFQGMLLWYKWEWDKMCNCHEPELCTLFQHGVFSHEFSM